jgi:hypothetical protein
MDCRADVAADDRQSAAPLALPARTLLPVQIALVAKTLP